MTDYRQNNENEKDKILWQRYKAGIKGGKSACPDANTLAAYLDSALPARQVQQIEEHIFSCVACEEALKELRGLLKMQPVNVPLEIKEKTKNIVEPSPPSEKQGLLERLLYPLWTQYMYARKILSNSLVFATIIFACIVGAKLGKDVSVNQVTAIDSLSCEISFTLLE